MPEEPENLTIRLLQEMRGSLQTMQGQINDMTDEIRDLVQRVDGNTLVFNLVAGVVHDHERRIERLEGPAE